MFKIGDFAKIASVPMTLLRYYDDIDLFKPAYTDPDSAYRYYSVEQIPRLNRILALRDLGMGLDQIANIMQGNVTGDEIRGMLTLRKAQIEQNVRDELMRLRDVEYRLGQIEAEGTLPQHDILLKEVPAQRVLGKRSVMPDPSPILALFHGVNRLLDDGMRRVISTPFALLHSSREDTRSGYDIEMGYVLNSGEPPAGIMSDFALSVTVLPAAPMMATLVYAGALMSGIPYLTLATWCESHGYTINGPLRELYLKMGDGFDHPGNVTEFQFPVAVMHTS